MSRLESARHEALDLLQTLVESSGPGAESVQARMLHSLKSFAAFHSDTELETLCHELETSLKNDPAGFHMRLLPDALPRIRRLILEHPGRTDREVAESSGGLRFLSLPGISPTAETLRSCRELRAAGRGLRIFRAWIAPEEQVISARVFLLLGALERRCVVVCAEIWTHEGGTFAGPVDPRDWLEKKTPGPDGGGVFRCLYSPHDAQSRMAQELGSDLVEEIIDSEFDDKGLDWTGLFPGLGLSRRDGVLQNLVLSARRPQGLSLGVYLASMQNWAGQISLLYELLSVDAADYMERLAQSAAKTFEDGRKGGPGRKKSPGTALRVLVESVRIPSQALNALGQILMQLMRNSIAHGLESPETRILAKKGPEFRIGFSLYQERDQIVMRYGDDGAGVDLALVKRKAELAPSYVLDDSELLEILISPGFSTKETVSGSAGRGMGLDIVAHLAREILGGSLRIMNSPGKSCSFELRFPAILFPLDVILVKSQGELLAVPKALVGSVMEIKEPRFFRAPDGSLSFHHESGVLKVLQIDGTGGTQGSSGTDGTSELYAGLKESTYLVLMQDGIPAALLPVSETLGSETILMPPGSRKAFSTHSDSWVRLLTESGPEQ